MEPKIVIDSLSYTFADGTRALREINLQIRPNQVFVLFGPARSGKTTPLRLLNRLSDLTEGSQISGTITFNGRNIFAEGTDVITFAPQNQHGICRTDTTARHNPR